MTIVTAAELGSWRESIGREVVEEQKLESEALRRYAVSLGGDGDVERVQPPLAHWALFLPLTSDDRLGQDGHPVRGDFLPLITPPCRMFASARMEFRAPLLLGETARMTSRVVEVDLKTGTSGTLVFATVDRVLSQRGVDRVIERQTYVYRDVGSPIRLPVLGPSTSPGEEWRPNAVNLFRFSATTFNSHRIHYDLPYATEVERYPALVVHGTFVAARLAGLAERAGPLAAFAFCAQAPLFVDQPIRLRREEDEVVAVRCDGVTAMTAHVRHAR